ncbi:MAG TPA: DNA-deoxyinosine glycosylase [Flavobacterium sp.]|nr:DNA-deoxyinosine glycosylase [Flavobacterium sp.]
MKKSFQPFIKPHTHSLFLGTLPSEKSLFEQQYYAHPQNKFWRLVYDVFSEVYDEDYKERVAFLLRQGFGLWDVLHQAEREGSLDTAIKNYEINDFEQLYQNHPQIKKLYFTSKQAYSWYYKKYRDSLPFELIVLASPSPANARKTYTEKLEDWKLKVRK